MKEKYNIFNNIKPGDKFVTMDGDIATYESFDGKKYIFNVNGTKVSCDNDGCDDYSHHPGHHYNMIYAYDGFTDEKKLQEIAVEMASYYNSDFYEEEYYGFIYAFKIGYHKSNENNAEKKYSEKEILKAFIKVLDGFIDSSFDMSLPWEDIFKSHLKGKDTKKI